MMPTHGSLFQNGSVSPSYLWRQPIEGMTTDKTEPVDAFTHILASQLHYCIKTGWSSKNMHVTNTAHINEILLLSIPSSLYQFQSGRIAIHKRLVYIAPNKNLFFARQQWQNCDIFVIIIHNGIELPQWLPQITKTDKYNDDANKCWRAWWNVSFCNVVNALSYRWHAKKVTSVVAKRSSNSLNRCWLQSAK